jgi:predicted cobalt transporter CbtA
MPVASNIIAKITSEILQPAAEVVFAAGFLLFLWGLVKFLYNLNEGGENQEGKDHMIWGIVGMVIMVSIWSIISLITNTFGLGDARNLGNGPATDVNRNQIQNVQFAP